MNPKRIAILGSTGSVGRQALEIIAADEALSACALSAGGNAALLAEQAAQTGAEAVAIADPAAGGELAQALPKGTKLLVGPDAATELVGQTRPDLVLTAVTGSAGLAPTLAAIECGCDLAIANKESLVMAGGIIMSAARAAGVSVVPVDSEHSAIFQCLAGQQRRDVRRVILTASGGPLRTWDADRIGRASLEQVVNHPTWQMGLKVTIDSATLMNKALEVIEAHWLFDLSGEQIEVLIQPESVVHACVEFCDGSVLAQMGPPSMLMPIAFALYYPRRCRRQTVAPLDLARIGRLGFERPDVGRFPAVGLGHEVLARGGTAGAVLSAADEVAVSAFTQQRISFGQIVEIVEEVLNLVPSCSEVTLESIAAADAQARRRAEEIIARRAAGPKPSAVTDV